MVGLKVFLREWLSPEDLETPQRDSHGKAGLCPYPVAPVRLDYLFVSAYTNLKLVTGAINRGGIYKFLTKP